MKRIFIETNIFIKGYSDLGLKDDDLIELQNFLIEYPDAGDLIPDTGGLRKLRWGYSGKGRRGGIRVIYLDFSFYEKTYLIAVYSKAVKETLSEKEKEALRLIVRDIILTLRGEYNE